MFCQKFVQALKGQRYTFVLQDLSFNFVLNIVKRNAGHSKWANIRHVKAAKDGQRAATFQRLSFQMKTAIKENGSADPKFNSKLAQVIDIARSSNMPVEKINDVLKKSLGSKDDLKQHIVEIKAGNVQILVELLTSRFIHAKSLINSVIKKFGAKQADVGFCLRNFNLRGIIMTKALPSQSYEKAEEDAIEAGAEEVIEENDEDEREFKFLTSPNDFSKVKDHLASNGYEVTYGSVEYVPVDKVELNEEEMETLSDLVKKIEASEDVNKVYDNVK